MKANRRYFKQMDDEGASVIVGAILLFALSFMVLVMVQSNFVPVWEQDAEAAHAQTVRSQMTFLKSQLERQVEESLTTPVSAPIDLDRQSTRDIFGNQYIPPGTLSLGAPDTSDFNLTSPELSITTVSDFEFVGLGESWDPIDGDTIENASKVSSIRVRFGADAKSYTDEEAIINVTDADGEYAGQMRIAMTSMTTNGNLINKAQFYVRTFNAANELINAKEVSELNQGLPAGTEPEFVWIYAMQEEYWFDRVLAATEAPFSVEFSTTGGMPAEFSASYLQQTQGGGEILIGGGSEIIPNYAESRLGTRLIYDSAPQYFVDQDLVLEYGGLLLVQGDAAVITSPPTFAVGTTSSFTSFTWTVPLIVDGNEGIAAGNSGIVLSTAYDHKFTTGTGPSATITLATEYPDAWATFWRDAFDQAGLAETTDYVIVTTADSAALTINGPESDATHDVSISIQTATVEVVL